MSQSPYVFLYLQDNLAITKQNLIMIMITIRLLKTLVNKCSHKVNIYCIHSQPFVLKQRTEAIIQAFNICICQTLICLIRHACIYVQALIQPLTC